MGFHGTQMGFSRISWNIYIYIFNIGFFIDLAKSNGTIVRFCFRLVDHHVLHRLSQRLEDGAGTCGFDWESEVRFFGGFHRPYGVSINGGTPNGWFIVDNPKIR